MFYDGNESHIDFRRFRHGCATSEDILWKLDALQDFIRHLHWVGIDLLINQRINISIPFLAGRNLWRTFRKTIKTNGFRHDRSMWEKV